MPVKPIKRTWMRNKSNKNKKELTGKKLQKEINKLKKPGKTYTPAQLMALKRKAQDKTISQVKAENEASMRKKAAARNAAFKASQKNKSKLKVNSKKDKKNKNNNNTIGYSEKYPKLLNLK
tara:strand:+ start:297 stop:659 length:363 start_codon:yes stop_codon:yes gene_type:complete